MIARRSFRRCAAPVLPLVTTLAVAACAGAPAPETPGRRPAPDPADVEFVTGMIPHHAQAVLIAGWAATHGARPDIRAMAERMAVAQRDEIELMRAWLRDHGLPAPEPDTTHATVHGGAEHRGLMPGMLTDEELDRLDRARGTEWDRLFLTFMIKHHLGAIEMVEKLFGSGTASDEFVFRLASDIWTDQHTDIGRMQRLLDEMGAGPR